MPRTARTSIEPRKRPRQERSQEMVERILGTAQQLSREIGIQGLTTVKIAQRAGLSIGSLYQYFPNKEAILVELARRWLAGFHEVLDQLRARPVPRSWRSFQPQLLTLLQEAGRMYRDSAAMLPVLELMAASTELRRIEQEHDRAIVSSMAGWLRAIQPALTQDTATRLGQILLGVGHVCLAEAAHKSPAKARLLQEDLETMMLALLRRHLGLR
jgi:AcrR family transcriptional regulator